MSFKPYTHDEILTYLEAVNCITDVQVISDYMTENKKDYSPYSFKVLSIEIGLFAKLFTV